MIIREYQLEELARSRKLQEDCRNLHMPIPPVLSWQFEVKDSRGSVLERGIGKANSFTRNAYNKMAFQVGLCSRALLDTTWGDGHINQKKSTDGTVASTYIGRYVAGEGTAKVYLGTGTTETLDDYAKPTYACSNTVTSAFNGTTRKLITNITGVYTNSTGSAINITEAGVTGDGNAECLDIHDVFTAISLANGSTITWTYVTEVAFPNP